MKKQITGFALCALLFALSFSAEAQQPKKIPRIGYLSSSFPSSPARIEAFRQACASLATSREKHCH